METSDPWATAMQVTEDLPHRRPGLVALRWALIALCAGLIIFSDHMVGRLGFAALLVLAVVLGRYGAQWHARARGVERPSEPSVHPSRQPSASEAPVRRRKAGQ
jgi:hypothetical protein